ncbi:MAG: tryptophan--tRNA ligase [Candidatus Sumerlaeales bacterium]|nr:tryptophan--tRNA ligase [Candidatus Sumerlaeales bacterium]
MEKQRILSGMRPTGCLHLGNYLGALKGWVDLQNKYQCYFMVADWHALTSNYADSSQIRSNIKDVVLDWLGAGIDPAKSAIFIQSLVPEHVELSLLLGMFTPLAWLERNPCYKDQIVQLTNKELETYGFLGYPVLMAADILLYRSQVVPVGEDQLPHLEITREIARRVNWYYGGPIEPGTNESANPVFPLPEALLSKAPKLLGLDGRKMSKSYNNSIFISDSEADVSNKVRTMITDPQRIRKTDAGNPDICGVYSYHKLFTPKEQVEDICQGCKNASIGCVACKKILAAELNDMLNPIRERRAYFEKNPALIVEILEEGTKAARQEAQKTMALLKEKIQFVTSISQITEQTASSK